MSVKVKTRSYFTFKTYVADNNNYGVTFNFKAGYINWLRDCSLLSIAVFPPASPTYRSLIPPLKPVETPLI